MKQLPFAYTSWVDSANDATCGFPLQSLPYCVFASADGTPHIGVGIGSSILDLHQCVASGLFDDLPPQLHSACQAPTLNSLIACGPEAQAALRSRLMGLLASSADQPTQDRLQPALAPRASATLLKPVASANYTDFYASIDHASRVGKLFRSDNPLLPNYKFVPIGYHGRASSIVVSDTPVNRPNGQIKSPDAVTPEFAPTRFLDYELEVAIYVTGGNTLGNPTPIDRAAEHIFGVSLLNDWSARDIQSWEYQPLGPFLSKNFTTSVAPWVVPIAALKPFRCPARIRPAPDPAPLPYLFDVQDQQAGAIDMTLEVLLSTQSMRGAGVPPHSLTNSNLRDLYWTPAQLIAHHTSNGCNLLPGDLLATGTVSGPEVTASGCLLELTAGGANPITLPNGELRTALEDGDEIILRGVCRSAGNPDVSLGECRGIVQPPVQSKP